MNSDKKKNSMIPVRQTKRKQPILKERDTNSKVWFAVSSKEKSKTVIKPIKKFDADLQREDFEDFVELFNQVLINQNIINTEVERMAQQKLFEQLIPVRHEGEILV